MMLTNYKKHSRTFHLPWSGKTTADDKKLENIDHLFGKHVVITEKLDGECSSLYPDAYFHARSLNGNKHPSQRYIKEFARDIEGILDSNSWIVGENLSAKHTVDYKELPHFFFIFGFCEDNNVLSWEDTEKLAGMLLIPTVPVLWQGTLNPYNYKQVFATVDSMPGKYTTIKEGYVVRNSGIFSIDDYSTNVAKFVGDKFKQDFDDDSHWKTAPVVWNNFPQRRGK